jgi:hypothetical protein
MLFDLRGRGRRRTIQGIYLFLALLMGGGLVFFGVGGTGVGLFNNDNNNSNGGGGANPITAQLKAAQRRVRVQPQNPAAWASLTKQLYTDASSGNNYDQTNHKFTTSGISELRRADSAFQRYLALKPPKLDSGLVTLMASAYGQTGLNDTKKASAAIEALTLSSPTKANYVIFAIAAAQAGQTRKSALAEQKAIDLTAGKAGKKALKTYIDQQKAAVAASQQPTQTSTQLPGG